MEPPELPKLVGAPDMPSSAPGLDLDTFNRLIQSWQSERLTYPGWVVIPESNRQELGARTDDWMELGEAQLGEILNGLALLRRTEALYEMVWRIRRMLEPVPAWLLRAVGETLEGFNPKPNLIDFQLATRTEIPREKVDIFTGIWVELAFALVNGAWQTQQQGQHDLWMGRLSRIVKLKPEWQAQWHHAQCWNRLMRLDEAGVRQALAHWPEHWGLSTTRASRKRAGF
jgi:hypothetical protein